MVHCSESLNPKLNPTNPNPNVRNGGPCEQWASTQSVHVFLTRFPVLARLCYFIGGISILAPPLSALLLNKSNIILGCKP